MQIEKILGGTGAVSIQAQWPRPTGMRGATSESSLVDHVAPRTKQTGP
jgi:hypothetical protein